jgi:hypothetical protein
VAEALRGAGQVALDLETTRLDPGADRPRLLALDWREAEPALIDCFAADPAPALEALAGKEIVAHNALFDLGFLARTGFVPTGGVQDTMILARMLAASTADGCSLKECVGRHLGAHLDKAEQKSDWAGELTEGQLTYAARDVAVLRPLLNHAELGILTVPALNVQNVADELIVAGVKGLLNFAPGVVRVPVGRAPGPFRGAPRPATGGAPQGLPAAHGGGRELRRARQQDLLPDPPRPRRLQVHLHPRPE